MTVNTDAPATPPKSPWKRLDTWGIIGFLVVSRAIAGGSVTQYLVQRSANKQIEAVKAAYEEAGRQRMNLVEMCLVQTKGAATTAAKAAQEAATKATAAQEAADKAAAAASSDVPK